MDPCRILPSCPLLDRQKPNWKRIIRCCIKLGDRLAVSEKSCFTGPIRILVIDDFWPFRQALHQLLDSFSGLTVVGEAERSQAI